MRTEEIFSTPRRVPVSQPSFLNSQLVPTFQLTAARCAAVNNRSARLLTSYSPIRFVKKLLRTKASNRATHPHCRHPFLDRTVAARRSEMVAESTAGIIPGDRGKVGGNWCRPPLCMNNAQAYITSSSGRSRVRSAHTRSGTERQGAIRNRARAESGPRGVSTRAPTQLPQRV